MREAVVVASSRTPLAKSFRGALNLTRPDDQVAHCIRDLFRKLPQVDLAEVGDVILGCAEPSGQQGHNVARIAVIRAGLPASVPATTVNRFCSSGLQAITIAAHQIVQEGIDVAIGGGVESITATAQARPGREAAANPWVAAHKPGIYMVMGDTAEVVAKRYAIGREAQDLYALASQQRTARAQAEGFFDEELAPIHVHQAILDKQSGAIVGQEEHDFGRDECNRPDTTLEGLLALKPYFDPRSGQGTVTAGNSSQLSDGASATLLMERKRAEALGIAPKIAFRGFAVAACEPDEMGIGPVFAVPKLLKRFGLKVDDIDLWELNEAFAVQVVYCRDRLGIDPEKLNIHGGSIAIGHPFGMTGSRMVGTLANSMVRRQARYGVVTMCVGGGQGAAALFERCAEALLLLLHGGEESFMSDFSGAYRRRLITHEELIARLRPGDSIHLGTWMGQPHGLNQALGKLGPEVDPLYVSVSPASAHGEFLSQANIRCTSGFLGPFERAARRERQNVAYTPTQYTDAARGVRTNRPPDYLVVRTAPMDSRGCFNLGLACSWEYDAIRWYSQNAPSTRIVVEVNSRMPRVRGLETFGNNEVPISDVTLILEDDTPPPDFLTPAPTETDHRIAAHVATLVEDRATIQLGIGSIPMVIGRLLAGRRDLGIHTELFCQSHLDLIEAGSVTNAHKGLHDGVSVATFALGDQRLYRWLEENPAFAMLPVDEINAVTVLARVNRMTSINSILTMDLTGQACAHCLGSQTYSGLGGAFEFAYGSQLSPAGKSILCLPSKTRLRDGSEVSNIVVRHPAGTRVTIPEHCVDWVVTEFGAVRLKFLSLEWRASALIGIAHPQYRDSLAREAAEGGLDLGVLSRLRTPPDHFFSQAAASE